MADREGLVFRRILGRLARATSFLWRRSRASRLLRI